jgi:hypothetical protein
LLLQEFFFGLLSEVWTLTKSKFFTKSQLSLGIVRSSFWYFRLYFQGSSLEPSTGTNGLQNL